MIRMNSLSKKAMLLWLFSLLAGFSGTLASGDEQKDEKDKRKADESTAGGEKPLNRSKIASSDETNAAGETGATGHDTLAQASGCLVDHAALEDLKRAREELDERRKDIAGKETDLKTREQVIADELRNLEKIRDEIGHVNDQKAKEKEGRVAKLVETFLSMSPKSAAKVLAGLEDSLAVLSMSQMDTPRLAKIMNNMDPGRSSHLAELLGGVKKEKGKVAVKKGER